MASQSQRLLIVIRINRRHSTPGLSRREHGQCNVWGIQTLVDCTTPLQGWKRHEIQLSQGHVTRVASKYRLRRHHRRGARQFGLATSPDGVSVADDSDDFKRHESLTETPPLSGSFRHFRVGNGAAPARLSGIFALRNRSPQLPHTSDVTPWHAVRLPMTRQQPCVARLPDAPVSRPNVQVLGSVIETSPACSLHA